jgi:hypothetical protein
VLHQPPTRSPPFEFWRDGPGLLRADALFILTSSSLTDKK